MMNKLIAISLCAVLALSFAACTKDKPEVMDDPQKKLSDQQIPNPWVDCKTIADAEKLAGFAVALPQSVPDGYTQDSIRGITNSTIQITYKSGDNQIAYRQGKGKEDISGVYEEYKENSTIAIGDLKVAVKGNGGKVNVATWVNGEYTFSISVNPDGKGLDNQVITDMIHSTNTNSSSKDEIKIPNPFVAFETLADAEKLAGFSVTLPEKMPEGYSQKSIEAIQNNFIQIVLNKGEDTIVIRKAKGNEDISGDYNQYSENSTLALGSLQVATKGSNGKVNVATWVNGEYSYSVFADKGIDAAVLRNLVSGIH